MPYAAYLIMAGVIAVLAVLVAMPIRANHKLRKKVREQFGKPPKTPMGLSGAEKFYESMRRHHPAPEGVVPVDDLSWSDLDGDDMFRRVNACQSAVGDVRLYAAMRRPAAGAAETNAALAAREELTALLEKDEKLRDAVRHRLARLGRFGGEGLETMVFETGAITLYRRRLYQLLALLPLALAALCFWNVGAGLALMALSIIANFNVYAITKNNNETGFMSVRYLASTLAAAADLAKLLAPHLPAVAAQLSRGAKSYAGLRRSITMLSFDHMMEESTGFNPAGMLLLPLLSYGRVAAKLPGKKDETLALFYAVGEVDVAQCVLSWRKSTAHTCRPQITEGAGALDFEGLYHPLLEGAVENGGRFNVDVLLTGSNASGKSTFIKAVALNAALAQALNTCTAARFAMRPGAIATSMAVADSVVDGDSYFVAEVKSMARLIKLAQNAKFSYLFIDEILKGTNTVERVAASSAVLRQLGEERCLCFAATHDVELTGLLDGLYDNYHFRETVNEKGVYFDYTLHTGPATTRNAILLLERMGFPPQVTANARRYAAHFEQQGDWDVE